ncbi:MAG: MATE family efflux transporter [Bacteroidales bacterium]
MRPIPSYRQIWEVAYPIILSLIAQNVVNVTDTAFLGRLGEIPLGASAIGGLFYVSMFMLGFGFATGVQILVGRFNGRGTYANIGQVVIQGFYSLLLFAFLLIAVYHLAGEWLINLTLKSEYIHQATSDFLRYRIWGLIPAFINVNFRAFYVGITRTRILSLASFLMAALNVVLDYALIFGHWGLPALGIGGAAIASVMAETSSALFFLIYTYLTCDHHKYGLRLDFKLQLSVTRQTLNLSVWVMLQNFVSLAGWLAFFMMVEKTGEINLAASNVIRSLYLVMMIPIWGFSTAVNTLVSNSMGANGDKYVTAIIGKVALMSTVLLLMVSLLTLTIPVPMLRIYTPDPLIIAAARPVMYLISGVLPLFSISIMLFSGVTGTANTRINMLIEFTAIFLYLLATYFLAIAWKKPLILIWSVEYLYFIILGGLSLLYLYSGHWKKVNI